MIVSLLENLSGTNQRINLKIERNGGRAMFCVRWQTYCKMCMRMSSSRALIMARQVEARSMRSGSGS